MKKSIFLVLMSFLLFIVSCKKKDYEYKGFENVVVQTVTDDHEWYYFTDDGFEKVEKPEFSPEDTKIAWTEAVRISSANNVSANAGSVGYAILNRIGLLRFTEDKITNKQFSVDQEGVSISFECAETHRKYKFTKEFNTLADIKIIVDPDWDTVVYGQLLKFKAIK